MDKIGDNFTVKPKNVYNSKNTPNYSDFQLM